MKVMLLAAGRGERMRPLTDRCPKPLLEVGGKALIVHLLERLVAAGFVDIVVNHAHLGERIEAALGDGASFGAHLRYSREGPHALETGGGIRNAIELLGDSPFLAVNADLWTDYPFARLREASPPLAHLVLVDNPAHNPSGDFTLEGGRVGNAERERLTFSGIGVYRPGLFAARPPGPFPLAPLLREAAERGLVSGEHYRGAWVDVGTPERLAVLDAAVRARAG